MLVYRISKMPLRGRRGICENENRALRLLALQPQEQVSIAIVVDVVGG